MANDTYITICGNLARDPELRYTNQNNTPVVSFTVMSTPRIYNRSSQEWQEGEPIAIRCSAWRQTAENVNSSLKKGSRVIVYGRINQHSFENQEGQTQSRLEITVEDVGASLRYATAVVTKTSQGIPYSDNANSNAFSDEGFSSGSDNSGNYTQPTELNNPYVENPPAQPAVNPLVNPFVEDVTQANQPPANQPQVEPLSPFENPFQSNNPDSTPNGFGMENNNPFEN